MIYNEYVSDLESLTEEHVISPPVSLAVDSTFPTHVRIVYTRTCI